MIETVTMFRVICDRCMVGADKDTDYYAWATAAQAQDVAIFATWLLTGDKHYCPSCTTWDEDHDEQVPLPALETQGGDR